MSRRDRIWFPVDVHYWDSPAIARAGVLAGVLYQRLLAYAMIYHTDGTVPVACVDAMREAEHLPALARVELVTIDGEDVLIPDWEKWHKLYAAQAAKREYDREYQRQRSAARSENDAISVEVQQEQVQDIDIASSYESGHDTRTSIVRVSYESEFETFWALYPLKVGKRAAQSAYLKALKRADATAILAGLTRVCPSWTDRRYIPHATTWLNRDGWEDEATAPSGPMASVMTLVQAAHDYDAGVRYF